MPIREARQILGPDYIIGGTANTFEDAKAHYEASADYIGCGPFRFTTTKKKLAPVLGLDGYRHNHPADACCQYHDSCGGYWRHHQR